jgi:hypothetical protein
MKTIITAFSAVTLGCLIPSAAQTSGAGTGAGRSGTGGAAVERDEGSSSQAQGRQTQAGTQIQTGTTFNADARSKAARFFEAHKGRQHGLPPAVAAKLKAKEIPQQWKSSRIEPGSMVQERERTYLVEAPADLVEQLPTPPSGVRYFIAGSNVIAVDQNYRVVDSIQIPTIQITEER